MLEFNQSAVIIFGFTIKWYGVLMALAVLSGVGLALAREKKLGFKREISIDLALVCVPAAIVAARLYYVVFEWEQFADNPLSILNLRTGGLAIYGGIIGGTIALLIYSRVRRISIMSIFDLVAPSLALGQAIGRWGNFLNQEAFGALVEKKAMQFFPMAVYIEADHSWHYATFFYESIWCLGIVLAIIVVERRGHFKRRGDIFLWYMLLYSLERSIVEGLRTDSLYLGSIRVSQLLSLVLASVVLILFIRRSNAVVIPKIAAVASDLLLWIFALVLPVYWGIVTALIVIASAYVVYRHTPDKTAQGINAEGI